MIVKVRTDRQKALALKKMAEITLERLEETDTERYPANTLTDYYDVLHKLMEAVALLHGVKTRGEGAHQELIDHLAKREKLGEATRLLLRQMRDYRNRISYEGFNISKNYIILNDAKINEVIRRFLGKIS
ncbi:hypothetical protein J4227_05140 [Candidatus Woesearchaeota archaeon]|nr:hypothetical protein [Candidatus Woesearchaeota archaeon]